MDVRGKLVDLIFDSLCRHIDKSCNLAENIADDLIRSGVTVQENVEMSDELLKQLKNAPITICKEEPSIELVQEWISVDDRLPDSGGYVVCIAKRNPFSRFMPMVARIEKNGWVNPITGQYISEVTHWMPLPQPPTDKSNLGGKQNATEKAR